MDPKGSDGSSGGGLQRDPSGFEITDKSFKLVAARDVIPAAVLSVGAVAAAIYFIHLSFAHPDIANLIIPLILVPLGSGVTRYLTKPKPVLCDKCKDEVQS